MKTLHAWRRRGETIEVEFAGEVVKFAPDASGDVVGECSDEMAEHLVHNTDGYKVHGEVATPDDWDDQPGEFVLTAEDGTKVDLALLTEDEVKAFAAANDVRPGTRKGDKLRAFVVKSLRAPVDAE